MNNPTRKRVLSTLLVVALGIAGMVAWQHFQPTPPVAPPVAFASVPNPVAQPPALGASSSRANTIQHPLEPMSSEATVALPPLADSDTPMTDGLTDLVGRQNMLMFWQPGELVRHIVATVDNLGRDHAPSLAWPIQPTPGRFTARKGADGTDAIHPDNGERYAPLVRMVESVDTDKAVALYRRLYPLFQQAYGDLGFPGRYFNDRLVAVLDLLISTPVPAQAPALRLVEVKGPVASLRPWVRYEYADPAWQALASGQKILLRVGPDNQQRLRAKLRDIRQRLAKAP